MDPIEFNYPHGFFGVFGTQIVGFLLPMIYVPHTSRNV